MACTMDEIAEMAPGRKFKVQWKIDSANNAQYAILKTKDGDKLSLRYEDKDRSGGVRTHVGSLLKDFPGTPDTLFDWWEAQLADRNYDAKIDDYLASMTAED